MSKQVAIGLVLMLLTIVVGTVYLYRLHQRLAAAEANTILIEHQRHELRLYVDSLSTIGLQRDSFYADEIERMYLVLADLEVRKAEARLREVRSNEAIHDERRRFRSSIDKILNQ